MNASKNHKNTNDFAIVVSKLVDKVFIPIAAGGGIRTLNDAELLFRNGADKLVINSALFETPELIKELVKQYGSQSIVASIDYKKINNKFEVYINDGTLKIDLSLHDYIKYLEYLEVGEIYLNSIDKDGTGFGYDFNTIKSFEDKINLPLIIAGGAGNESHLIEGLSLMNVNAVATANLFNFVGDGLPNARKKIIDRGFNIAKWN